MDSFEDFYSKASSFVNKLTILSMFSLTMMKLFFISAF